jgi:cyclophilin family peptidyl-prolyl cis-trans isomerase
MKRLVLALSLWWLLLPAQSQTFHVLIRTDYGNMKIMLYDDTPKHRDEFLRLVDQKHFDGTLFYRSVKDFVIQGGSSDSRNAPPGKHIGYGDEAVNIDSEFSPRRFHKKGAVCAPRQPEKINFFKSSDISQFYIVKGRVYTSEELDKLEIVHNNPIKREIRNTYYLPYKDELEKLKTEDPQKYNKLAREIKETMDMQYRISNYLEYSEQQRGVYTTIGGTPELDNEYTVFGEIVEGMNVIDKIAAIPVDDNDRPLKDVKMTLIILGSK